MIVKKIKGVIVSFPSEKIMREVLSELDLEEEENKKKEELGKES
ncbi:MAG: hypothetical protein QXV69_09985 [Sulfolobaceae archaeon]